MLTLNRVHKLIIVIGFIESAVLLVDVSGRFITGTYLSYPLVMFLLKNAPRILAWFNPWLWTLIFVNRNIDINTTGVISMFFGTAVLWIVSALAFVFRPRQVWWWLIVVSLAGFWYVPLGVWLGVIQIVLLSVYRIIAAQN